MTVGEVTAYFRVDMTKYRAGLQQANGLLEKHRRVAQQTTMVLAGVGAGMAAAFGVGIKWASDFEAEMRNVNSILKASEEELASYAAAVLDLAAETGQAPRTLARGLYDVASSGFAGAEGLKVVASAAKAATAGLSTTATAARAITAILNAYGMQADQADHISDVLFKTVERGVLTFEDLAQNIGLVVSAGAAAGVTIEEIAAAIATATKAGIQASEAFTALNRLMLSMVDPQDDTKEAAKELGLEWDATALAANGLVGQMMAVAGKLKHTTTDMDALAKAGATDAEIMEMMASAAGTNMETLAALFPEIRALKIALVLAAEGGATYAAEFERMQEATGATASAFAEQSKSLRLTWAKTWATVTALVIEASAGFLPFLRSAAAMLKDVVLILRMIPGWMKTILAGSVALTAGMLLLTAAWIRWKMELGETTIAALGFTGAMAKMSASMAANFAVTRLGVGAFRLLKGAVTGLWAVIVANPWLLVIGVAIAAIAKLISAASEGNEKVKRLVESVDDMRAKLAKAGKLELVDFPDEPPSWWSRLMEGLGYRTQDYDEWAAATSMAIQKGEKLIAQAELEAAAYEQAGGAAEALAVHREGASKRAIVAIEKELAVQIKAITEGTKSELKKQKAIAALREDSARRVKELQEGMDAAAIRGHIRVLESQGRAHEARVRQIGEEAKELAKSFTDPVERAIAVGEYIASELKNLAAKEAEERAKAFEDASSEIVSTWTEASNRLRATDRITVAEHVNNLSRVIEAIRAINALRREAGLAPILQAEEANAARTILQERKRLVEDLASAEKRAAADRKGWAQEELEARRRLYDLELRAMDLFFQHQRDVLVMQGIEATEAAGRTAKDLIAALSQMAAVEDMAPETRLDIYRRQRQAILEAQRAGQISETEGIEGLKAAFAEAKTAIEAMGDAENAAVDARRTAHQAAMNALDEEETRLRDMVSGIGEETVRAAESVFASVETHLDRIADFFGGLRVAGAAPAGAAAAGGDRNVNLYIGGGLERTGTLEEIMEKIGEHLERELEFRRD